MYSSALLALRGGVEFPEKKLYVMLEWPLSFDQEMCKRICCSQFPLVLPGGRVLWSWDDGLRQETLPGPVSRQLVADR